MSSVFEDGYFSRQTVNLNPDPAVSASVITDSIDDEGIKCCHISIDFTKDKSVDFVFEEAQELSSSQGRLTACGEGQNLLWIPKDPVSRLYDNNGRIQNAAGLPFEVKSQPDGFMLSVTGKAGYRVEFGVVIFTKNVETFKEQLLSYRPVELRSVARSNWFYYEGIKDVWDYFVKGTLLRTRHQIYEKGWESQNIALALYYYLDFLHNRTAKQVYALLCDFVAYSVMLSLPADNRWRHGIWTDIAETHTVHQVAGIHLFLSYYERTGRDVFLRKAKGAMDLLISIADELSEDKVWFLHDTLETNMTDSKLYYNVFPSEAFGKSVPNTLTLNSHIWTLTALYKLKQLNIDQRYGQYFEKGLDALKAVLGARPCNFLFGAVYRLRDTFLKLRMKTQNRFVAKADKIYSLAITRYLLPLLKKTFPRVVMPNGFIERDLSGTVLSNFYHLLNIEDILILYNQTKFDWFLEIAAKSVKYSVDSSLAGYVMTHNPKAMVFLDILLLYSGVADDQYLPLLPRFLAHFQKLNASIPTNILSNPLIADPSSPLRADNENVLVLTPAGGNNLRAVIVNATDEDQQVTLTSILEDETDKLQIVDSTGSTFVLGQGLTVPKSGFLKVTRK